jgi:hypothetical protein
VFAAPPGGPVAPVVPVYPVVPVSPIGPMGPGTAIGVQQSPRNFRMSNVSLEVDMLPYNELIFFEKFFERFRIQTTMLGIIV